MATFLTTGETWPTFVFDEDDTFDPEDDRWYYVECEGSHAAWQDMADFIEGHVMDPTLASRLGDAIQGRGAFSRFTGVLREHAAIRRSWQEFRDDRAWARAQQWLLDRGLTEGR